MPQKRTKTKPRVDPRLRDFAKLRTDVTALSRRVGTMTPTQGTAALQPAPRFTAGITTAQQHILEADPTDSEIAILPTGELYLPHLVVRRRLNKAFGTGTWVVAERSPVQRQGDQVVQTWSIDIDGLGERARATGGAEYRANNPRTTWDDAIESAKSIAISRCGKAMGIGIIMTDRRWVRSWRGAHCVVVQCTIRRRNGTQEAYYWRRRDDEPLDGEHRIFDPKEDAKAFADAASRVRRKLTDTMVEDAEPARPAQSKSGATPPGQQREAARPSNVIDAQIATTTPFQPPKSEDTPQVFVRAEFVRDAGSYKLHRCETAYAVGDGRTGRAEFIFFDPSWLDLIKKLIQRQQPCTLRWEESQKQRGTYKLIEWQPLTGAVK
jgi:hypothetical protein